MKHKPCGIHGYGGYYRPYYRPVNNFFYSSPSLPSNTTNTATTKKLTNNNPDEKLQKVVRWGMFGFGFFAAIILMLLLRSSKSPNNG